VTSLHSLEECATQHALPPPTPTTEQHTSALEQQPAAALIVDERLCVWVESLDCLQRLACLAQRPINIHQFSLRHRLAGIGGQFARALAGHLNATKRVPPVSATNLNAPDEGSVYDHAH
jgi:hypothetical protein